MGSSVAGKNQQMDVLGHVNERVQEVLVALNCPIDALLEHHAPGVLGRQWEKVIAGKRQFLEVVRLVEMPNPFAMYGVGCHSLYRSRGS